LQGILVKFNVFGQSVGLRLGQLSAEGAGRVIAVTAGSEGVGRTAVIVNLAIALTRLGMNVLVVDECPGEQSAGAVLNAMRSGRGFGAVTRAKLPSVLEVHSGAAQFDREGAARREPDDTSAPRSDAMFGGSPDIVLIDSALDKNGGLSPLASKAQDVMVVMRLSADAVADAYVCMRRLHFAQNIADFRVIVNLLDGEAEVEPVLQSLREIARDYLSARVATVGCIAADPCIERAVELSRCVADAFPASPAATDFARLAAGMQSWPRLHPASCRRSAKPHSEPQAVRGPAVR
jgi:flagellar biosynthesis protein FlhG